MPRMTNAERNARADARARANGYTSRSQQYRAKRQGYRADEGAAYNLALRAARATTPVSRIRTAAGLTLTADLDDQGAHIALIRAMRRATGNPAPATVTIDPKYDDELSVDDVPLPRIVTCTVRGTRAAVIIETEDGEVVHIGDKGGMRVAYLLGLHRLLGEGMWQYLLWVMFRLQYVKRFPAQ